MDATVSFIEFGAADPAAAGPFLTSVFGWSFTPKGKGGMVGTPGVPSGMHGDDPERVYIYFRVADLEQTMAKVRELGGTATAQGPAGEYGRFADCVGPGGVAFGLHQAP